MLVLGLDFETTGLDITKARIIEIGAVLWDTDLKMPLEILSVFVYAPDYSSEEIKKSGDESHGIPLSVLEKRSLNPDTAFNQLNFLIKEAQYVVGHNIREYDFPLYREDARRVGVDCPDPALIDTTCDVPYPAKIKGRSLTLLAAEHGFINPFPHRAVTDVLTMMKIFSVYDLSQIEHIANSPTLVIRAKVSYDDREKAKARGYRWDKKKEIWTKPIKDFQLAEEQKADFQVIVLGAKA
jgi:DNA polymerase III subunit epsilon